MFKKIALALPPVKKVHKDLENRRRRVSELEGHLQIMKTQMADVLTSTNSDTLSESQSSSDINHVKGELKKLNKQYKALKNKHEALYKDFCIVNMSNEYLTKTNSSLLDGGFSPSSTADVVKTKTRPRKASANKKSVKKTTTKKTTVKAKRG